MRPPTPARHGARPRSWRNAGIAALLALAGTGMVPQVGPEIGESTPVEGAAGAEERQPGAPTQAMAARLATLAQDADIRFNSFLNAERVAALRAAPRPTEPAAEVRYLLLLGEELLLDNQNREAIRTFERIFRLLIQHRLPLGREAVDNVQSQLALAYLRLGEEENCVLAHNLDRCLLPIRGEGVHRAQRGSRAAVAALRELLATQPQDLGYRWLLNIAHMTLGEHPDGVPENLLIPPEAFASEHDLPRFFDVAPQLGLDVFGLSGGVVLDDFTGDGLLDLMVSGWGLREQIRFFINNGDGTFSERTEEAGLTGLTGGLNLVQADATNNGLPDVLVLRGAWLRQEGRHPSSLLRNDGDGTFSDVTEEAGLLSFRPTQTAAWADYDNDGWVDLVIGNESTPQDRHPSELYRNRGDGTFEELASAVGLDIDGFVKGVVWGDVTNDGLVDLYVSRLGEANSLFLNRGPGEDGGWRFEDVARRAGVTEPEASFPAWFWDYDNDGWVDIFVSGYRAAIEDVAAEYLGLPHHAELPRLYRNRGDATFEDVTERARLDRVLLTMGANFGDLDNDGFPDLYAGTGDTYLRSLMPNRMLRNDGGKRFQDVTTAGGFGHLQKGHGIAFGDLNNDGQQDIYAVMGGAHSGDGFHNALFANPGGPHRWLTLRLEGVTANRAAIGARIEVVVETPHGRRRIHATVGSGGSFGAGPLRSEIGLGEATTIVAVDIAWPGTRPGSEEVQRLEGLELDRFYRVRQGEPAEPWEVKTFPLPTGRPAAPPEHHHSHR